MRGSPCSYRIPGCWVKHIRHVFPESLVQTIAMSATCDLASLRVGLLLWKMEMKYILFWHMKGFSDQWWLRPLNLVHPNKASARKIVYSIQISQPQLFVQALLGNYKDSLSLAFPIFELSFAFSWQKEEPRKDISKAMSFKTWKSSCLFSESDGDNVSIFGPYNHFQNYV